MSDELELLGANLENSSSGKEVSKPYSAYSNSNLANTEDIMWDYLASKATNSSHAGIPTLNPVNYTKLNFQEGTTIPIWNLIADVPSKVIEYDPLKVTLECLLDRDEYIYEIREYPASLFNKYDLNSKKFFKIRTYCKFRSC